MGWRKSYQEALVEALRLNAKCVEKFGGPPQRWRYRVRKRQVGRHDLWRIYGVTGEIPPRSGW